MSSTGFWIYKAEIETSISIPLRRVESHIKYRAAVVVAGVVQFPSERAEIRRCRNIHDSSSSRPSGPDRLTSKSKDPKNLLRSTVTVQYTADTAAPALNCKVPYGPIGGMTTVIQYTVRQWYHAMGTHDAMNRRLRHCPVSDERYVQYDVLMPRFIHWSS